jgi:hypothetical protein
MRKRNSQTASDQRLAEEMISRLQSSLETFTGEAQQCEVERVDAETLFHSEPAKLNELQGQLDQLDQILASPGRK